MGKGIKMGQGGFNTRDNY